MDILPSLGQGLGCLEGVVMERRPSTWQSWHTSQGHEGRRRYLTLLVSTDAKISTERTRVFSNFASDPRNFVVYSSPVIFF